MRRRQEAAEAAEREKRERAAAEAAAAARDQLDRASPEQTQGMFDPNAMYEGAQLRDRNVAVTAFVCCGHLRIGTSLSFRSR